MNPQHLKVLILENDDFLREILGNLLHKHGCYVMNGSTIERGVEEVALRTVNYIVLGTSCTDFDGKSSINFLRKKFSDAKIFLVNNQDLPVSYIAMKDQMLVKELSIKKIIEIITSTEVTL